MIGFLFILMLGSGLGLVVSILTGSWILGVLVAFLLGVTGGAWMDE